jgi:hypothetical protein
VSATARRLAHPGLECDEVVVGLATAVSGAQGWELWQHLDDAALPLFGLCGRPLEEQADGIWTAVTRALAVFRSDADGTGTVLLDRALSGGGAHTLLLAACGHGIARRAGLRSAVAQSRRGWWTALLDDNAFLPIGYGQPAAQSAAEFRGCCAHRVAHAMLEQLRRQHGSAPTPQARRAGVLRAAVMCGHEEL